MKKIYSKPYIAVESFQLNAAIAGSCGQNKINIHKKVEDCSGWDEGAHELPFIGPACVSDSGGDWADVTNTQPGDQFCYQAHESNALEFFIDS